MKKIIFSIMFVFFANILIYGQKIEQISLFGNDTVPIKYFSEADTLPMQMAVFGEIIDFTKATKCCVPFSSSGTIKVKLLKKNENYPFDFVYIVVPCLNASKIEILKKVITINIVALYRDNEDCIRPIINHIESGSIPFYLVDVLESKKLYNKE